MAFGGPPLCSWSSTASGALDDSARREVMKGPRESSNLREFSKRTRHGHPDAEGVAPLERSCSRIAERSGVKVSIVTKPKDWWKGPFQGTVARCRARDRTKVPSPGPHAQLASTRALPRPWRPWSGCTATCQIGGFHPPTRHKRSPPVDHRPPLLVLPARNGSHLHRS